MQCREVMCIYDLQINCMFGNMHPNVVTIDNGPYLVLFRDLTVKNGNSRIFVNVLKS